MEALTNLSKANEKFRLLFLRDDEEQSVEVEEVGEINFEEVKERLQRGESVFITRKREQPKARKKVHGR